MYFTQFWLSVVATERWRGSYFGFISDQFTLSEGQNTNVAWQLYKNVLHIALNSLFISKDQQSKNQGSFHIISDTFSQQEPAGLAWSSSLLFIIFFNLFNWTFNGNWSSYCRHRLLKQHYNVSLFISQIIQPTYRYFLKS